MDVLYVGTLPPHHGGSAVTSAQLLAGLAARGHGIRAVAPITASGAAAGDRFARTHPALDIHRFLVPNFETSPDLPAEPGYRKLEHVQIRRLFAGAIAERRFDVVFSGRESFAWHVPELARRYNLPLLQRVAGSTALGILRGTYPPRLARGLIRRLREADVVVVPARHLAQALGALGVPDVEVVPNPVDLERFQPQPKNEVLLQRLGLERSDFVVMHLSNLKALKRVEDLIVAVELLAPSSCALSGLIVGKGPCRRTLEDLVAEKGLEERIRFIDWVDYERVPEFLNIADLVVMPSGGEAQARVYLETQACGRTLIASDIPAAREVIDDGKTGLLFRTGDPEDLAAKIRSAADPALRAEIGRNARQRVSSHAVERIVRAYETLLDRIVSSSRGQPARGARRAAGLRPVARGRI